MVISASRQATQNTIMYEKEKVSTQNDAHRQGRADLKKQLCVSPSCRCERWQTTPHLRCSHKQGSPGQARNSFPLTHTKLHNSHHSCPEHPPSRAEAQQLWTRPQSLLSPSAAMTGLNAKCILHTQHSHLMFTATCFNSSLSSCARQTGTQESMTSLEIVLRPSSVNVKNQTY